MSDQAVLRRSLLPGQRAAIILEFAEMVDRLRKEAKESSLANLKRGNEIPETPDLGHRENRGKSATAKALAEKAGIGRSSMEYLIAVQRETPDLFDKVKAGEMTIMTQEFFTFIKVFEELGGNRTPVFDLGIKVLYQIATMPEEDRDKSRVVPSTGEVKKPEDMTSRELQEVKL